MLLNKVYILRILFYIILKNIQIQRRSSSDYLYLFVQVDLHGNYHRDHVELQLIHSS